MPRRTLPLSDTQIRTAKSTEKDYKLFDGGGLFLLIKVDGSKLWRCKYLYNGTEKLASIGIYPTVTLSEAREKQKEIKKLLKDGVDPNAIKKEVKQAQIATSESQLHLVIQKYLAKIKDNIVESTFNHTSRRLERDILPFFAAYRPDSNCTFSDVTNSKDMREITHTELLSAMLSIEKRGAIDTVHKVFGECNRLWLFAINSTPQHATQNIVAMIDKKHALKKLPKNHFASTTNPDDLKRYMEFTANYNSGYIVKYALQLLPYIFLRAGNIRNLEWSEIDFEKKLLSIKSEKMKVSQNGDFVLPLPKKAMEILNDVRLYTHHSKFVFPSPRNRAMPISDNTLSKALRDNGFKDVITPHGFRAVFSSLAYENSNIHGLSHKVIEACLHHGETNKVAGAYNYRANYLPQMTILMDWWDKHLETMFTLVN